MKGPLIIQDKNKRQLWLLSTIRDWWYYGRGFVDPQNKPKVEGYDLLTLSPFIPVNALNQESALSCICVLRGIILATVSANFKSEYIC